MPTTQVTTPNEHAARARKAVLLAEVLGHFKCTAADATVLTDKGWEQAAQLAEVNEPSETTRSAVVAILAAAEVALADPFQGFPQ